MRQLDAAFPLDGRVKLRDICRSIEAAPLGALLGAALLSAVARVVNDAYGALTLPVDDGVCLALRGSIARLKDALAG